MSMMKNAIGFYMQRKTTRTGSPIVGWHMPTKAEFEELSINLGGFQLAGGKLKEAGFAHWNLPNVGGTNSSGFNARGAGVRMQVYSAIKTYASFWTTTPLINNDKYDATLHYNTANLLEGYYNHPYIGLSIRLIKDDSINTGSLTDYDGNVYNTVKIGTQVWLAENLRVRHFNDGSNIPLIINDQEWLSLISPGMSFPNNDEALVAEYGILYNWYTFANGL